MNNLDLNRMMQRNQRYNMIRDTLIWLTIMGGILIFAAIAYRDIGMLIIRP